MGCEKVDWVHLAQDRDPWRALVSTVLSLWVPRTAGEFTAQLSETVSWGYPHGAQLELIDLLKRVIACQISSQHNIQP
jgi:hypothetical protein